MRKISFNLKNALEIPRREETKALIGGPRAHHGLRIAPASVAGCLQPRLGAYARVNPNDSDDESPAKWPRFYQRRVFWCGILLLLVTIGAVVTLIVTVHRPPRHLRSPPPPPRTRPPRPPSPPRATVRPFSKVKHHSFEGKVIAVLPMASPPSPSPSLVEHGSGITVTEDVDSIL